MPRDSFGREIDYLRISLTDQCNLRCIYCMPLNGLRFAAAEDLLTPGEIETVARVAARMGFRKVRFTGGEPTLRADLLEIVERVSRIEGIEETSVTTNGILMTRLADPLRASGLDRVNIHIDSLHGDRLREVMRFALRESIWAGILACERAGFSPIKLNCVVVRGRNDEEVVDLARLTLDRDWHVRFIELMPFGSGECANVSRDLLVTTCETRRRIEDGLGPLEEIPAGHRSDESRNYRAPDARGVIGFISPVSEPYCGSCNRMRLTADGKFHLCLLRDEEVDVRGALRNGAGEQEIEELLLKAVAQKPIGHELERNQWTQGRIMVQIGG